MIYGDKSHLKVHFTFSTPPATHSLTHLADAHCDRDLLLLAILLSKGSNLQLITFQTDILSACRNLHCLDGWGTQYDGGCWGESLTAMLLRPLTLTEGEGHINLSLIPSSVKGSLWCQPKGEDGPGQRY